MEMNQDIRERTLGLNTRHQLDRLRDRIDTAGERAGRWKILLSSEKVPDIANASALGWQPRYSLDEIIAETAEFYRVNGDTRGADARAAMQELEARPI